MQGGAGKRDGAVTVHVGAGRATGPPSASCACIMPEPDINALVWACDVHDVPCATNLASARMLLAELARAGFRC